MPYFVCFFCWSTLRLELGAHNAYQNTTDILTDDSVQPQKMIPVSAGTASGHAHVLM